MYLCKMESVYLSLSEEELGPWKPPISERDSDSSDNSRDERKGRKKLKYDSDQGDEEEMPSTVADEEEEEEDEDEDDEEEEDEEDDEDELSTIDPMEISTRPLDEDELAEIERYFAPALEKKRPEKKSDEDEDDDNEKKKRKKDRGDKERGDKERDNKEPGAKDWAEFFKRQRKREKRRRTHALALESAGAKEKQADRKEAEETGASEFSYIRVPKKYPGAISSDDEDSERREKKQDEKKKDEKKRKHGGKEIDEKKKHDDKKKEEKDVKTRSKSKDETFEDRFREVLQRAAKFARREAESEQMFNEQTAARLHGVLKPEDLERQHAEITRRAREIYGDLTIHPTRMVEHFHHEPVLSSEDRAKSISDILEGVTKKKK